MLKLVHALEMNPNNVFDYYKAFANKKDIQCFSVTLIEKGVNVYFDYLIHKEQNVFYLIEESNPNYIIGVGKLQNLDKPKNSYELATGNIAYSIRPEERKKGYATELLHLLLIKCEELGKKEVCVSCLKNNIASQKVILHNAGKLEKEFFFSKQGYIVERFQIKLHPKLTTRILHLIK